MFTRSNNDVQDDDKIIINEHIDIRKFFTRQNFPNPDSSKFSTVKLLRYTVYSYMATSLWHRACVNDARTYVASCIVTSHGISIKVYITDLKL